MSKGQVELSRKTAETDLKVQLRLRGSGEHRIETGIGLFDHLLGALAYHGQLDLNIIAQGDLEVDTHHLVEDTGLLLGQALRQALGDKAGIRRFSSLSQPMDEALVHVALDISGRPYLNYELQLKRERIGELEVEVVDEFWRAFSSRARIALHLIQLAGKNEHHLLEASFKGVGRTLKEACQVTGRDEAASTKGRLD